LFSGLAEFEDIVEGFFRQLCMPYVDMAPDEHEICISIDHESFVDGFSKRDRYHTKKLHVNAKNKKTLNFRQLKNALESVAQSNSKFSLDGVTTIEVNALRRKTYQGSGPKRIQQKVPNKKGKSNSKLMNIVKKLNEEEDEIDFHKNAIINDYKNHGTDSESSVASSSVLDAAAKDYDKRRVRNPFIDDEAEATDREDSSEASDDETELRSVPGKPRSQNSHNPAGISSDSELDVRTDKRRRRLFVEKDDDTEESLKSSKSDDADDEGGVLPSLHPSRHDEDTVDEGILNNFEDEPVPQSNDEHIRHDIYDEDDFIFNDTQKCEQLQKFYKNNKNIVSIKNSDDSCGYMAFAYGKQMTLIDSSLHNKTLLKYRQKTQKKLRELAEKEIDEIEELDIDSPVGLRQLSLLQNWNPNLKLVVIHRPLRFDDIECKVYFEDTRISRTLPKVILEFVRTPIEDGVNGHFNVIKPDSFHCYFPRPTGRRYESFCWDCLKPLKTKTHTCTETCRSCGGLGQCEFVCRITCSVCRLWYRSVECLNQHISNGKCATYEKCGKCSRTVKKSSMTAHLDSDCNKTCRKCHQDNTQSPHQCCLELNKTNDRRRSGRSNFNYVRHRMRNR